MRIKNVINTQFIGYIFKICNNIYFIEKCYNFRL